MSVGFNILGQTLAHFFNLHRTRDVADRVFGSPQGRIADRIGNSLCDGTAGVGVASLVDLRGQFRTDFEFCCIEGAAKNPGTRVARAAGALNSFLCPADMTGATCPATASRVARAVTG